MCFYYFKCFRRCLGTNIFFNGCRDGHYDRGGEEILKYDRVQPNAGEGLDPATGIFTCPVGGTYMFIIHLSTHKDKVTLTTPLTKTR